MSNIPSHRRWMYNRTYPTRGGLKIEFIDGVETFIKHAKGLQAFKTDGVIRCPCIKCLRKWDFLSPATVTRHLYSNGFKPNYWYWTDHGEIAPREEAATYSDPASASTSHEGHVDPFNRYVEMCIDAARQDMRIAENQEPNRGPDDHGDQQAYNEELPNAETQKFFDLLRDFNKPVWSGCDIHSPLSVSSRLMSIQNDYNVPHDAVDEILQLISELLPPDHTVPTNFYETRKLVKNLGLVSRRIDCCVNGCMLYYKDDENLTECKFCGAARYKTCEDKGSKGRRKQVPVKSMHYLPLIPRLKRLYASMSSAPHMKWHAKNRRSDDVMGHPCYGKAWKHFDQCYPEFANEPRNVRLALCADGFTPYSQSAASYSCWPVIVTPYNLPPEMCMTMPYMFLTCIIPGPKNPKQNIDVYLQPLNDELKELWEVGVTTYDASTNQNS